MLGGGNAVCGSIAHNAVNFRVTGDFGHKNSATPITEGADGRLPTLSALILRQYRQFHLHLR